MKSWSFGLRALALLALGAAAPAHADWLDGIDFKGSLGPERHTRYVPPLANPLFNETPYITTEIRPIYIHQRVPKDFLTGGGTIKVIAAELRVALTDRLGFIASKDGYADIDWKGVLPDTDGLANISAGLKYAVISDPQGQGILTMGVEYEPPTGNLKTDGIRLQGRGSGFIDVFVTGAKAFDKLGLQGSLGANVALDNEHDSSLFHYSAHVDYELFPNFFPLIELNGWTTIDNGTRTPVKFDGVDLVNLGGDSGTIITGTIGARYRLTNNIIFGLGYEEALTNRKDILDWRLYADVIIHF